MAPTRRPVQSSSVAKSARDKLVTHSGLKQMLNAQREKKYFTGFSESSVNNNGAVLAITQGIIQGDTAATRDGSQINFAGIDVNMTLEINSSSTIDFVRLLVFEDHQNNGALPAVADILVRADPNSPLTRDVRITNRYTILHDKSVALSIAANNRSFLEKVQIRRSFKISYLGTTDAAASNGKNSVFFLLIGDAAAGDAVYTLDWAVYYYDS